MLKQEYSQSIQRMLRQLLKSILENNTDHLQKKQITFRIKGYDWNDVGKLIQIEYDNFQGKCKVKVFQHNASYFGMLYDSTDWLYKLSEMIFGS